jgi:ABC-2 type transport system permease protein
MRKTIVVAVREYQAAVKTKAFIISIIFMPILMGGSIVAQYFMRDRVDTTDRKVAVVDQTGVLFDDIAAASATRDQEAVYTGEGADRRKVRPRFVFEKAEPAAADPGRIAFDLSERVRSKDLFAFVIIGPDVVDPPSEPSAGTTLAYYSNTPTYDDIENWLRAVVNEQVRTIRFREAGVSPDVVTHATGHVPVVSLGLVELDEHGNLKPPEASNRVANILVPIALMMLMWMVVFISASPLMQSVVEEKMQRIAEVLLGSVSPFELMMGKLLGIVGVSLTMATIYLVGGYIAIHNAGFAQYFPGHVVWWFVLFQGMAVLLYGSIFIAIGAACSDMKEAQNMLTPVMIIVVSPMLVWFQVLKEPLAPLSLALSLFPPATPMLMIVRQAVPPGVPLWQPLLGVALVLLSMLVCVVAAGRIFRVGILIQGKGATVGQMIRWVFRG